MNTSEYPINNGKLVVFDDLINASDKIQSKIADGRHHSCWMLMKVHQKVILK